MDIQKEREAFEDWYIRNMDTNGDFEKISEQDSPYMDEHVNNSWLTWQAAKAQAVPEWIDYSKQSPRIDGPYQIFIMNQQLVAEWESPWGFSSIEDGDALNQELITHWSVLGSDPVIEAQEPAND